MQYFDFSILLRIHEHDTGALHRTVTFGDNMKPDLWMNGEFVPWDKACIHPLCHSLQRGATLFESIDCNETHDGRPAVFRLREHMVRLENSARIVGMPLPYDIDTLFKAVVETVAHSGLKSCVIRPLAFYADVVMEVYPGDIPVTVVIGLGEASIHAKPLSVKIGSFRKIDSTSMPVKAKVSGNYIGPMMVKAEAKRAGYDEAVILDSEGYVAEGSTSNIFIIEDGVLFTAPDDAILPGITRDSIIEIAGRLGYEVRQEKFTPERMMNADEAILCSSGKGAAPIVRVEDTVVGDGSPGRITSEISTFYMDVIAGKVPEFDRWLTCV